IPDQPRYVGALFLGDAVRKQPGVDAVGRGLGDALAVVAQVGAALGVVFDVAAGEARGMHPGRTATVRLDGEPVGFAAELLPSLAAELDLPRRAAVVELNLDRAIALAPRGVVARPIGTLPAATQD